MNRFKKLFGNSKKCAVIGMVHVKALPGTPKYGGCIQEIIDKSCEETEIYMKHNLDGIMIENMHDIPYQLSVNLNPETTAIMTRICNEIKRCVPNNTPCGVQILAGGNKEALAVALASRFDFIRCEGFVFGHIGDEGLHYSCAGPLLRYRREIDAENILIWTDIKKKHSAHAITQDVTLVETAKAAEFFLSDGLILTGNSTGDPADTNHLRELKQNFNRLPIIIGSGVTKENLSEYFKADALVVGSYFKRDGFWSNDLDEKRIGEFMERLNELRDQK